MVLFTYLFLEAILIVPRGNILSIGNYKSCNFPVYTYNTYDVKGRYVTNILNNSGTKTKEYEYNAFVVTEFATKANTYNPCSIVVSIGMKKAD